MLSCFDKIIKQAIGKRTMTATEYKHIIIDDAGVPIIAGTTIKVIELVTAQNAYSWSPQELHLHYPHIKMSQIYSALAYYWDRKEELDADMERRYQYAEKLRREAGESPFVARMRSQGLLI